MKNHLVLIRKVTHWKSRKYVYRVPMKGKVTYDAGYFYCPYIPLFSSQEKPRNCEALSFKL